MMMRLLLSLIREWGGYVLASVAIVVVIVGSMVVGMVAIDRPACYERSEAMGAANARWGWRVGCLIQVEEDGPHVPEDLLRYQGGQWRWSHAE